MFRFERRPQTYANHAKDRAALPPVAFGILLCNLRLCRAGPAGRTPGFAAALQLLLGVAL
jgi:hypothetical protein